MVGTRGPTPPKTVERRHRRYRREEDKEHGSDSDPDEQDHGDEHENRAAESGNREQRKRRRRHGRKRKSKRDSKARGSPKQSARESTGLRANEGKRNRTGWSASRFTRTGRQRSLGRALAADEHPPSAGAAASSEQTHARAAPPDPPVSVGQTIEIGDDAFALKRTVRRWYGRPSARAFMARRGHRTYVVKEIQGVEGSPVEALEQRLVLQQQLAKQHRYVAPVRRVLVAVDSERVPWGYIVTRCGVHGTLAEFRRQGRVMGPAMAEYLAYGLAAALYGLHKTGVAHGDLHPGSVTLRTRPKQPWSEAVVLLLDLEPTMPADLNPAPPHAVPIQEADTITVNVSNETIPGLFEQGPLAKPEYLAPERLVTLMRHRGHEDHSQGGRKPAHDCWAVGCVVFELLVGEGPFEGSTAWAAAANVESFAKQFTNYAQRQRHLRRRLKQAGVSGFWARRRLGRLLACLLDPDPATRITVAQLLDA